MYLQTLSPTLLCCLSIWWCRLHYNIIALWVSCPEKKSILYPSSLSLELTELLSLSLSLLFPFSLLIVIFHLCRIWVEWCAGQFGKSLRDQLSAEMELNSLSSTLVITCKDVQITFNLHVILSKANLILTSSLVLVTYAMNVSYSHCTMHE